MVGLVCGTVSFSLTQLVFSPHSWPQYTRLGSLLHQPQKESLAGIPADGKIDKGADITFMGQGLFMKVAATASCEKNCRKPDKVQWMYDQRMFH